MFSAFKLHRHVDGTCETQVMACPFEVEEFEGAKLPHVPVSVVFSATGGVPNIKLTSRCVVYVFCADVLSGVLPQPHFVDPRVRT